MATSTLVLVKNKLYEEYLKYPIIPHKQCIALMLFLYFSCQIKKNNTLSQNNFGVFHRPKIIPFGQNLRHYKKILRTPRHNSAIKKTKQLRHLIITVVMKNYVLLYSPRYNQVIKKRNIYRIQKDISCPRPHHKTINFLQEAGKG